jgi:NADH dehydrogenase
MSDYIGLLSGYYPSIDLRECRLVIIERRERLFPDGDDHLSRCVKEALERRGVEVLLNTHVTRISHSKLELDNGASIEAENLFWNAGTRPSPVVDEIPESMVAKHNRRILVDDHLRVPVFENVYVVGDDAAIEQKGRPSNDSAPPFVPPTAEAALEEGTYVGRCIGRIISGEQEGPSPFAFKEKGVMLSLGHRYGVVKFRHITLKGIWGWIVWRMVHIALLSSQSGRFSILVDWTLGSFKERDISELGEVPSVLRAPTESDDAQ